MTRRRKTLLAITAVFALAAAAVAGALAGLGQADGARVHTQTPYLRHPEFARRALLLARAAGAPVTPALREAARAQAARPRMLWRGASMRFSVFSHAASASQLPTEVGRFVAFAARATHISRDSALSRVRLLRSNVGSARGSLYALEGGAGAPCFILTHYGGTCGTAGSGQSAWIIGGGHDGNPDVLVGLAPDDVVGVSLILDGRAVPVSLDQNVVYAQFPIGGKEAKIATTHVDGSVTTEHLGLNPS